MEINWSAEKNEMLKGERGLDLANIADSIRDGYVLDGIPYQTLAAMILKKYVQGALLDRDAVREVVKALRTA